MAVCQNPVPLVNIKIAGKWMFIPLKMVLIGIDPYPHWERMFVYPLAIVPSDRQGQSCWSSPAFVVFSSHLWKNVGVKLPGVTLRREMPCWCTQKDCSPCPSHVLNWQKQHFYVWHVALMAADADIFPWSTGKQWWTTTSDRCRPLICARRHGFAGWARDHSITRS